jgi:hypothetical protein
MSDFLVKGTHGLKLGRPEADPIVCTMRSWQDRMYPSGYVQSDENSCPYRGSVVRTTLNPCSTGLVSREGL